MGDSGRAAGCSVVSRGVKGVDMKAVKGLLGLLGKVLQRYDLANLWAATGWFLERFRETFHVPEGVLARIEGHRPRSPQYLERGRRGGRLVLRWNLILPEILDRPGEADEP